MAGIKILAFDLATQTGVAVGCPGEIPQSFTIDLGQGRSEAARFAKAIEMTRRAVDNFHPDLVVVEAAIGGPTASQYLAGMMACVLGQAHSMGIPTEQYQVAQIRKHFLGKHLGVKDFPGMSRVRAKTAIKDAVMARCKALRWPVADHNAADAVSLWDLACSLHSKAHGAMTTPLFAEGART